MRHALPLLILIIVLKTAAFGQTVTTDSVSLQTAKQQAIRLYERVMYRQEAVYAGNEYITQDHRIKIHPFYPTDSLQAGTITYNGIPYHDVAMLYDIVRDEIAVRPPEGGYHVQVRTNKISDFSLGGHRFIRLTEDSVSGIPPGFYELLYQGGVSVLAHRQKTIHEDISGGTYKANYLPKDRFYIQKEGVYHEVKKKASVLALFPDQSKVLRKYLRANKLKFNDDQREQAIMQAAKKHDELMR